MRPRQRFTGSRSLLAAIDDRWGAVVFVGAGIETSGFIPRFYDLPR